MSGVAVWRGCTGTARPLHAADPDSVWAFFHCSSGASAARRATSGCGRTNPELDASRRSVLGRSADGICGSSFAFYLCCDYFSCDVVTGVAGGWKLETETDDMREQGD
eukprot:scaffold1522_cov101-Isochrysis_galbana.AAC.5